MSNHSCCLCPYFLFSGQVPWYRDCHWFTLACKLESPSLDYGAGFHPQYHHVIHSVDLISIRIAGQRTLARFAEFKFQCRCSATASGFVVFCDTILAGRAGSNQEYTNCRTSDRPKNQADTLTRLQAPGWLAGLQGPRFPEAGCDEMFLSLMHFVQPLLKINSSFDFWKYA